MNSLKLVYTHERTNTGRAWETETPSTTLVKPTYGFVDTTKIIDQFGQQGWRLADARQAKVRNMDRQGYQKHLLRFRNDNYPTIKGLKDQHNSIPELIVENSHDGTSALRLFFGVFRIACLNGIVAGSTLTSFRVIHSKNSIRQLDDAITVMADNVPVLISKVESMNNVELTHARALDMAERAAALRLEHVKNIRSVAVSQILKPTRFADVEKDAYSIFNVIQEKVIRGGIEYTQMNERTGRLEHRKTRGISSVSQSIKLNRELWNIAEAVLN